MEFFFFNFYFFFSTDVPTNIESYLSTSSDQNVCLELQFALEQSVNFEWKYKHELYYLHDLTDDKFPRLAWSYTRDWRDPIDVYIEQTQPPLHTLKPKDPWAFHKFIFKRGETVCIEGGSETKPLFMGDYLLTAASFGGLVRDCRHGTFDWFSTHLLLVQIFPLIFAFFIIIFYTKDLYKNVFFGHKFYINKNTKTFFVRQYDYYRNFYSYIFFLYWKKINSFFLNLPSPKYFSEEYVGWFPYVSQHLYIYSYIFAGYMIYSELIFFSGYETLVLWLYMHPIIVWFSIIYVGFADQGLTLKLYLVRLCKWASDLRFEVNQNIVFLAKHAAFPIIFSYLYLILTSYCLIRVYMLFFFQPVYLWDGYFKKTMCCLYYYADYTPSKIEIVLDGGIWLNWDLNVDWYTFMFEYFTGLDGLNIWMIWLTSLLVFLCSLFLWDNQNNDTFFSQMGWIFLLQYAAVQFFFVVNYFWMYVFFELSLLPIYVLIVYWGSNRWKIHAAYQMVLFTFIGSIFLLGGIFVLFLRLKTFNLLYITDVLNNFGNSLSFSLFEKKLIWFLMFIGFAVKTPLYPFHIWLPEAHSEAPTTGSVLLAGVLLKMGTYGFMWFVMPLFPELIDFYKTLLFSMCICGVLLSSLSALAQIDIKKIIAYSSIGHMGLVILGLCTLDKSGLMGGCFMMLSHGLVSGALFFSIGLLYKIYGTWSILHYSSIAHFMPWFSMCFYIFILANMGFPGTAGFPAEVLIFSSVVGENFLITLLIGLGSIICGTYSIWLLTRLLYGQINSNITLYRDLKPLEWKVINYLAFLVILFGVFPYLILDFFKPFCKLFEINITLLKLVL